MIDTLSKNKIAKLQRKQQELFDKFTRQLSEIEKMSSVESKYTQVVIGAMIDDFDPETHKFPDALEDEIEALKSWTEVAFKGYGIHKYAEKLNIAAKAVEDYSKQFDGDINAAIEINEEFRDMMYQR